jgi:hypothetical protein
MGEKAGNKTLLTTEGIERPFMENYIFVNHSENFLIHGLVKQK